MCASSCERLAEVVVLIERDGDKVAAGAVLRSGDQR
jgi:hypothetical protein